MQLTILVTVHEKKCCVGESCNSQFQDYGVLEVHGPWNSPDAQSLLRNSVHV